MQKNSVGILFFLVLINCFFSCKKDVDTITPVISFSSPLENQFFNVNDIVHVRASVTDETKITRISVSLVDALQNAAHTSIAVPVTSRSMSVDLYYSLDNIHLETGTYYILITASDGVNDSRRIQKISIAAVPRVVKQVLVASYTTSSQTTLSYIDSTFSGIVPLRNLTGDYIGSSASSYYQRAFVCGNYTGHFTGINLEDNSIGFDIAPAVSVTPYFTGFYNAEKNNYTARYEGTVKGYDYNGNLFYSASAVSGYYAEHFIFNSGYLVAQEQQKTSASKILVTYYPTGVGEQQIPLNQDVVDMCELDDNNVFLFGNLSGQGIIQLFDRIANNIWNPYPYSLAPGILLSVVKIDADTYLFGLSNGTIYKYQYSISSVTSYLTGYTAIKLKYDEVNNEVYVVEHNRITTFNYSTAGLHHTINSTDTLLDVHVVYNR